MYEQRYGLKKNPFRLTAEGSAVFIGPQQAKIISSLQNGLSGSDNVVLLSGPAGIGKTAILTRALETNKAHQMVASIGRMRLASDEVLELLLTGFGVSRQPTGTVQRFAAFQRILAERTARNIRIVIVVEDALRIGDDALLELEALTADNTGAGGANMVLMGTPQIHEFLARPELARLKQRVRKPQRLEAFTAAEVLGYLKHLVRVAGGEFEQIFAEGAASMVFRCSGGIPRVINNLCDAALAAAIDTGAPAIAAELVQQVALDVYDIRPGEPEPQSPTTSVAASDAEESLPTATAIAPPPGRAQAPEPEPKTGEIRAATPREPVVLPKIPLARGNDPGAAPALPPVVAAALAQEREESMTEPTNEFPKFTLADIAADEERIADTGMTEVPTLNPEPGDSGEFDIADDQLICDTGMMKIPAAFHPDPDLDIKPSRLAQQGDRQSVNDDDDLPTLSPVADDLPAATMPQTDDEDDAPDTEDLVSLEAEPTAIFEKPEFELPPSDDLSEMPKIEKIRHSIADAERAATRASATEPALEPAEAAPSASMSPARPTQAATAHQAALRPASSYNPIPDLDKLEAAISAARRSEPDGAPARSLCLSPTPDEPVTADNQQQAATLAVVAEPEIEQSKLAIPEITLDQTLEDQRKEGEKLDAMAAELANIDSLDEISDLMAETLFGQEFEQFAAEALANPPARGTLPGEEPETDVEHATMDANGGNPANDESVSASLPAKAPAARARLPEPRTAPAQSRPRPAANGASAVNPAAQNAASPESIEDQIETSITQTLKAINPANIPELEDDDDDKPRGLFGRLKRSLRN